MTSERSFQGGWAALQLVRNASRPLADQLASELALRIQRYGLRPGTRLPSIRHLASLLHISRFTVVESYERLVAAGLVSARPGSGFFVRPALTNGAGVRTAAKASAGPPSRVDVSWLLRSMFAEGSAPGMPGGGVLPADWLDPEMVAAAVRAVGRSARSALTGYGSQRGFALLRYEIALRLQEDGIAAHGDENLLTTAGVTHALDLLMRHLVQPGDVVFVEDPAWFVIFARLAAFGARVIGIPRGPQGPDVTVLETLAEQHRPKLFLINAAVHNPTGHSLSRGVAEDVLRVAARFDFLVVDDDTYGELHPGNPVRLAALDGLQRVVQVGGYSKTLAGSLRVGYLAGSADLIQRLADLKALTGLTTPELGERVVHRVLADGQYRRHVERVRRRVDAARHECLAKLSRVGVQVAHEPYAGMFVWGDCGRDTEALALEAAARGLLLAPATLFSPDQRASSIMRFSVPMVDNKEAWKTLGALMRAP